MQKEKQETRASYDIWMANSTLKITLNRYPKRGKEKSAS